MDNRETMTNSTLDDFMQMYQIARGLEDGLDVSKYSDPNFHWKQMHEIRRGLKEALNISTENRK